MALQPRASLPPPPPMHRTSAARLLGASLPPATFAAAGSALPATRSRQGITSRTGYCAMFVEKYIWPKMRYDATRLLKELDRWNYCSALKVVGGGW